ncbi:hypothetical protein TNCV_1242641 [Trichonephila clavipes]|nr:hypothetical protein TNCV_1242641 [Trichonephila clavipes]
MNKIRKRTDLIGVLEKISVLLDCPIVSSQEFVAVENDNGCTASIITDKDILVIDANYDDEKEMTIASPVSTSFKMLENHEKEHRSGGQGLPTSLPFPPTSREDLRLDGYLKYPLAVKALYIYKHHCLLWVSSGRDNLVVKVTDSWPVYHEFEPSTVEDPPCRGRCMLNMSKLKCPPVVGKLGEGDASSGDGMKETVMVLLYMGQAVGEMKRFLPGFALDILELNGTWRVKVYPPCLK